jgi:hypothetical protein
MKRKRTQYTAQERWRCSSVISSTKSQSPPFATRLRSRMVARRYWNTDGMECVGRVAPCKPRQHCRKPLTARRRAAEVN